MLPGKFRQFPMVWVGVKNKVVKIGFPAHFNLLFPSLLLDFLLGCFFQNKKIIQIDDEFMSLIHHEDLFLYGDHYNPSQFSLALLEKSHKKQSHWVCVRICGFKAGIMEW